MDIRAASFIAQEEVSSPELYNEQYAWPNWPAGERGVTIGIGYDLRFAASFQNDWDGQLNDGSLVMLNAWVGQPGSDDAVAALAGITVSWQAAWTVFTSRTLPRVLPQARGAFPGMDKLPLLSAGALVSLVYNRGPGMATRRKCPGIFAPWSGCGQIAVTCEIGAGRKPICSSRG